MAENYHSWAICKNCNKALTEMLGSNLAWCNHCGAAQQPSTCNTGHSIRLNIDTHPDDHWSTKWLTAFDDVIQLLLNMHNETQNTVTIKYNSVTDTIKSISFHAISVSSLNCSWVRLITATSIWDHRVSISRRSLISVIEVSNSVFWSLWFHCGNVSFKFKLSLLRVCNRMSYDCWCHQN